jgi:hypothetical protein
MVWHTDTVVSLRILGKTGHYPDFPIRTRSHLFVPTKNLVWSAVVQRPVGRNWQVGEIYSLLPEEVRLFSSITLCEGNPCRNGYLYPTNWAGKIIRGAEFATTRLNSSEASTRLSEFAIQLAEGSPQPTARMWTGAPDEYALAEGIGSSRDALALIRAFDIKDQLLVAGVARLLGANRIMATMDAEEEAAVSLMVSLGAAMEFIRQGLSESRGKDQEFLKVYDYLRCVFPTENYLVPFLEEMYEARVMIHHPSSRYGDVWAPPLMADDVWELRRVLTVLYRHIILNEMRIDPIG